MLDKEELCTLYGSQYIVETVKICRLRWADAKCIQECDGVFMWKIGKQMGG
jgi:hypothetical protein